MIYNQSFIKINGTEYFLTDLSRDKTQDLTERYSVNNEYIKTINQLESRFLPELETSWLTKNTAEQLKTELKKNIVTIEGIILSPYYGVELTLDSEKLHPVLIAEVISYDLHQITFELEEIK